MTQTTTELFVDDIEGGTIASNGNNLIGFTDNEEVFSSGDRFALTCDLSLSFQPCSSEFASFPTSTSHTLPNGTIEIRLITRETPADYEVDAFKFFKLDRHLNLNGGTTPTLALLPGSPALAAAPINNPDTSQNGFTWQTNADIGAWGGTHTDGDGVADQLEDTAPNSGDGNNDSVPDREQDNVASFPNAGNGSNITIVADHSESLRDVSARLPQLLGPEFPGVTLPAGVVNFEVRDVSSSTMLTVFVDESVEFNTWYKYGPTPDNQTPHWYEFLYDGSTGAQILEDRVVLHFVDGERGDSDLSVNGTIVDPGAPAYVAKPTASSYLDLTSFAGNTNVSTSEKSVEFGDSYIAVEPSKSYVVSGMARSGDDQGNQFIPDNRQFFGFASYDSDRQLIRPWHVMKSDGAVDTALAEELKPGDSQIVLVDATGWANAGPGHQRSLAWYGYQNNDGDIYADYTYTRNVARDAANGLWDVGGITGNVITLNNPWSGPTLPEGSSVRNATSGASYNYAALNNGAVPNEWETYSSAISGNGLERNQFRPGTAFIKPIILSNYQTATGNLIEWKNVRVRSEVGSYPAGQMLHLIADEENPNSQASYHWSQVSGPTVEFLDPNQSTTQIVLPATSIDTEIIVQVDRTIDDRTESTLFNIYVLGVQSLEAHAIAEASVFNGSDTVSSSTKGIIVGDSFVPVDPSMGYQLIGEARSGDDVGGQYLPSNRQYFGFASYDVDHLLIRPWHVKKYADSTDTTLAQDLNPNDTHIFLTDATDWANENTRGHQRQLAWYGYTDSEGNVYPDYSYTRNVTDDFQNGLWDANGLSGNVITLREPWSGPALRAGDAVRNASSGATYNYSALVGTVPRTWNTYGSTVQGTGLASNQFRPGTAYIKPLMLSNYQSDSGNLIQWRNVSIQPLMPVYQSGETINVFAYEEIEVIGSPTYSWDQISGPDVVFTNADQQIAQVELPSSEIETQVVLQVTRTIDATSTSALLTIDVNPNVASSRELALDTNEDHYVSSRDALVVINYLNRNSGTSASGEEPVGTMQAERLDVNRDGRVSVLDALSIINYLNLRSSLPQPARDFGTIEDDLVIDEVIVPEFETPEKKTIAAWDPSTIDAAILQLRQLIDDDQISDARRIEKEIPVLEPQVTVNL